MQNTVMTLAAIRCAGLDVTSAGSSGTTGVCGVGWGLHECQIPH